MVAGVNHQPIQVLQKPKIQLTNDEVSLLKKLKNFGKSSDFKKAIPKATPIELSHVLQEYCSSLINDEAVKDPLAVLDKLSKILPMKKLQEAVKDDFGDALNEAKNMFEEAKLYLNANDLKLPKAKRAKLRSVLDKIVKVIESLISAIGIGDFFKSANNQIQGEMKSQKIMILLSLFTMITTLLVPVAGAAIAGGIVGGIFLTIALLSLIWPRIKPMPTDLPADALNLTKAVQKGDFVAEGRKEALDDIANIMKMGRHAILVGPSRVGKSSTSAAFAEAVARGDYPELKGKIVFRINASNLVGQKASFLGGGNTILREISDAMGRHRDKIILVLDEIHMACKGNEKIADQLKTFLDDGGDFPHVIGITTDEEYETHVKNNKAFSLRFDKVTIQSTDKVETMKILGDTVLKSRNKPILGEGVLEEIFNQTQRLKDAPQPATAVRILKKCMVKTERLQRTPTEQKVNRVATQIQSLRSQAAASRGKNRAAKDELAALQKELLEVQKKAAQEKKELERLYQSKKLFDRVTMGIYSTAVTVSGIAKKKLSARDKAQVSKLIILNQFMSKALESFMDDKGRALGVNQVLDKKTVNEAVQEYKQEFAKAKKEVEEPAVSEEEDEEEYVPETPLRAAILKKYAKA